jgi:hypothetical protein
MCGFTPAPVCKPKLNMSSQESENCETQHNVTTNNQNSMSKPTELMYRCTRGLFQTQPVPLPSKQTSFDDLEFFFRRAGWVRSLMYGTYNMGGFTQFTRNLSAKAAWIQPPIPWKDVFNELNYALASHPIADQNWVVQIDLSEEPEKDRLVFERNRDSADNRGYCTVVVGGNEIYYQSHTEPVPTVAKDSAK